MHLICLGGTVCHCHLSTTTRAKISTTGIPRSGSPSATRPSFALSAWPSSQIFSDLHLHVAVQALPRPFSRSPRPARRWRPYLFALLASPGTAPFGRTPHCRLGTPSSPFKTFLFVCTTISAPRSRPTSKTPWPRLGRREFVRRSSGALGMIWPSAGKDSDVWTFWAVTLSHRALRVLSRRTRSGASLSVESPHHYHHHHNLKPKKKCIICYLPTNPGAPTPTEVL
jgi:hypothetical protein